MFLRVGGECFESVYLGLNTTEEDKERIIQYAQKCNPEIKIFKMTMDPHALRLKEEPTDMPSRSRKKNFFTRLLLHLCKLIHRS